VIANNNFTPETAEEGLKNGSFEAVSFGRYFINSIFNFLIIRDPDFVERVTNG
jgi:2,4-dienoyl-CoA reductase-like NADH-dependent reductase (Old Yellow Enzyme family)